MNDIKSQKTKVFIIGSLSQENDISQFAQSLMDEYDVKFVRKQPNKSFTVLVKEAFDNILEADILYVILKPNGMMGDGTTYEVEYAKRLGKEIHYIESNK